MEYSPMLHEGLPLVRRCPHPLLLCAAVLALALGSQPASLRAATLDLEEVLAPTPPPEPDPALLPNLSETLDPEAKRTLADAFMRLGNQDFAGAEEAARLLTESHPYAPETWYALGLSLANLNRLDEALVALDVAASLYKKNAEPLMIKGDILLSMARREEASAAWKAAVDVDPSNFRAQERLAAYLETTGALEEAIEHFRLAMDASGEGRLYPRLQVARLSLMLGRPAEAEALLDPLADAEDAPDEVLDYLARAKAGLEKTDEARVLFEQAAERRMSPRPLIALALLALAEGRIDDAIAVLARAEEDFPEAPQVFLEQGKILGATGKYVEALRKFDSGLRLSPDDADLLRAASLAAARLGNTEIATGYALTLANRPGATSDDRIWLASLLESSGNSTAAAEAYRTILNSEPDNFIALNNLAGILAETSPQEALELAGKASNAAPHNPKVRDTLGWAQYKAGKIESAAATFEALLAADPGSALTNYRLGLVRLEQGRAEEGRALLLRALELDPSIRQAEEAKQRLK